MILVKNALLPGLKKANVLIEGDKITSIGGASDKSDEVIDADGMLLMPGFFNAHTHVPMSLFRGLADDLPLQEWLEKHIWPAEDKFLDKEFVETATKLSLIEMIKSGTTAFLDMYTFEKNIAEVAEEIRIRAFLAEAILDFDTKDYKAGKGVEYAESLLKNNTELVTFLLGPHAPYTCSKETLEKVKEAAEKQNAFVHMHVAETRKEFEDLKKDKGMTPVEYIDSLGLLNDKMIMAHAVWLSDKDVQLVTEKKSMVAHCPSSNAKLGSGIARVRDLVKARARVSIGTDGCASNNVLDMFKETHLAALMQKAVNTDPTVLPAETVFKSATSAGYEFFGLNNSLEEGSIADVVLIDLKNPHSTPLYDYYSHLAYSAKAGDVDTVIINGRVIMKNHEIITINEEEAIVKANEYKEKIKT